MPPGNNNAKPAPRGKCTYCRRQSCRGDNCNRLFEGVCTNSSGSQSKNSGYSSGSSGAVGSTYSTSQISSQGRVATTDKELQPTSTLQPNTITAINLRGSTAFHHVQSNPTTTVTFHPESEVQPRNTTDNSTKAHYTVTQKESFSLSPSSNISKAEKEVGTNRSHLNVWKPGLMSNEQEARMNVSGTVLTSSTKVVNSNTSVSPDVKMEKSLPPLPSTPVTLMKLLENKENAIKSSLITSNSSEADLQKTEFKIIAIKPQTADVNINDGIEPPVSKASSTASLIFKNTCNSDAVDKTNVKQPKSHHSRNALKYEGVVFQILNPRSARVKVCERNGVPLQKSEWGSADAVHKFVLLIVDKIKQDDQESFYPSSTPINSVLSKKDILILICTAHNKPSNEFQLFAHEARRTGQKVLENNDADSVVSFCSHTGSETQESTSSKTKKNRRTRRKHKMNEVPNVDSCDVSDVVNQWLNTNEYPQNKNETSKTLKIIGGCHYFGKVIELRLPYAFIIEVSSNGGKQVVFVFSNHFHPQGISSPAMTQGVSLKSYVNVGDEMVVIPNKNTAMQENKFEWVASKAWPKNVQSTTSNNLYSSSKHDQVIGLTERLSENLHQGDIVEKADQLEGAQPLTNLKSVLPSAKNWKEFDGIILSLQYDWGLVKEAVRSQSAYVFTRENAYLFGLCLQHFFLNDVMKEGQVVTFYMETEESGAMYAKAVCCGNKLPDFNSFDIATSKYCEEKGIKFSTEDSLIQHGKLMYFGH